LTDWKEVPTPLLPAVGQNVASLAKELEPLSKSRRSGR
jgi:hypothetical protein